jgi:hypothetical protein
MTGMGNARPRAALSFFACFIKLNFYLTCFSVDLKLYDKAIP